MKLSVDTISQISATVSVYVSDVPGWRTPGRWQAGVYEVGVDGSRPDSPVAVGQLEGTQIAFRIGTPFRWSAAAQPGYAIVFSVEQGGRLESAEIQFGFDAGGQCVITKPLQPIAFTPAAPDPRLPSLFVIGDSTAFSNGPNQRGWGDELVGMMDAKKVNVLNRARPGRSTRSFRNEDLWARALAEMKAGDIVLLQFGHNDRDTLAEGRCRGVLLGVGQETQTVTLPEGRPETVRTFGAYLRQYIAEIQGVGATPVLLSITPKNQWQDGRVIRPQSPYGQWSAAVAAESGLNFMDVTGLISDRYDALGQAAVQSLFCSESDDVHTSPAGARLNAGCVVAEIRKLYPGLV